ncbi:MAG: alpha/beta hydrolase, partial [Bradymonadaceae bacterium]
DFDRQDLKAIRSRAKEQRPFLGRLEIGIAHACTVWPDVGNGSPDISATDAPPMLIVNAEGDSATPMKNAEAMQSALDNGSHLLRWEGRKHGVLTESACTREAIQAFMIDPGTAPETTTCSG